MRTISRVRGIMTTKGKTFDCVEMKRQSQVIEGIAQLASLTYLDLGPSLGLPNADQVGVTARGDCRGHSADETTEASQSHARRRSFQRPRYRGAVHHAESDASQGGGRDGQRASSMA